MTTKFTPGPWVSGWNGGKTGSTCPSNNITCGDKKYIPVGYGVETVAIVVDQDLVYGKGGTLEANAHLIAAAPELYGALFELLEGAYVDDYGDWCLAKDADVENALKAIAKARGES